MKLNAHIRTEVSFDLRYHLISLLVKKKSILAFKGVFFLSIPKMSINAQFVWWFPIKLSES